MYHHLLANGDGINYSETSTFPTGWGATTAVVAPVAINHATVVRTQDLAAMRSIFAAKLQADAKGFQFPNPINLPATVNIGAFTGTATPRQTLALLSSGYAAPVGLNLSSNGDKLLLWNSGTFKADIGINANELWLQSQATDGKITLRTGNNLDSVDILGTGALQANFGVTVGTAAQFQVSSAGIPKFGGTNTSGSNAAQLGSNCPAVSCSAPYTWIQITTADGSTAYLPVYK
jgi:hypothetical protein